MLEAIADIDHRRRTGKGFAVDERVRFHGTGDAELDGFGGTVLGCMVRDHPAAYIVHLDRPLRRGDRAVAMTECCLEHDEINLGASRLGEAEMPGGAQAPRRLSGPARD